MAARLPAITDSVLLTVRGTVIAAGSVNLAGANIAIAGEVTDGGSGAVNLIATAGTISETGTIIAGTSIRSFDRRDDIDRRDHDNKSDRDNRLVHRVRLYAERRQRVSRSPAH